MKKSKLLSVLTAGAVIATTVGTYAVWDSLTVSTAEETVQFRKPVTVTVGTGLAVEKGKSDLEVAPKATGTVTFNVSNEDDLAKKLTITPEIKSVTAESAGSAISASDFDIVIKSGITPLDIKGTGFEDTTVSATETYTVEVTPKGTSIAKVKDLTDITLKLTAELSK